MSITSRRAAFLSCLAPGLVALAACNGSTTASNVAEGGAASDEGTLSVNAEREGGPCASSVPDGGLTCGANADGTETNAVLFCNGGVYERVFACPDATDCLSVDGQDEVACGSADGTLFGVLGGVCVHEDYQVCSFDQQTVLRCIAGVWTEAIHCAPTLCQTFAAGEGSCTGSWCGNCGFTLGDLCSFAAGSVLCSTDLASIVQCESGTVTLYEDCGSGQCSSVDSGIACQ